MMEDKQLLVAQGEGGIGVPLVVTELHLKKARSDAFDDGTHLSPAKSFPGIVFEQSNYVEKLDIVHKHSVPKGQSMS